VETARNGKTVGEEEVNLKISNAISPFANVPSISDFLSISIPELDSPAPVAMLRLAKQILSPPFERSRNKSP
jgi:hypothetical protein